MNYTFYNCSSLISLDLPNFNTSNVTSMNHMFYNCSSLISLNLANFDTSKVIRMEYMFYGCYNLNYINLQNFNEIELTNSSRFKNMFYGIPDNFVICINENNTKYKIFPQITEKACYTLDCSNDWKLRQKS